MGASKLKCRECGAEYELEARYVCDRCFGPLEVAYDHGDLAADRTSCAAASRPGRRTSGATRTSCRSQPARPVSRASSRSGLPGRLHAADPRRPPRRAPRPARGVGQERRRQPHALLQGPRRLGRLDPRPRARLRRPRLRLDRQPGQLGRRPRRRARHGDLRLHPVRPRGAEDPRDRRLRDQRSSRSRATTTTSTGSAPSSRASATGPSSTSTCARTTPRAPRRSRTRSPSSSAGRRPTASSRRSPPARCTRRSPRASTSGSSSASSRGDVPTMNGAQADGLLAGRRARSPPAATSASRCRPTTIAKSLAIGNPADGPYALDLARRTRRQHRPGHRRRDPRGHPPAGRDDRHLHRDRRRRDDRGAREARRARRHRPRRARRARHHRRGPEDARRGARHVRVLRDRAVVRRVRRPTSRAPGCASDGGQGQAPDPAARRRRRRRRASRSRAPPSARSSTRCSTATASCATACPTATAACGASSTSTSTARTSASATGSTRRWPTARRSRSCPRSPAADRAARRGARRPLRRPAALRRGERRPGRGDRGRRPPQPVALPALHHRRLARDGVVDRAHPVEQRVVLDALGDDVGAGLAGERRHREQDGARVGLVGRRGDDAAVELDELGADLAEHLEARVARADVVERELEALLAQPPEALEDRRGAPAEALGDLDDDAPGRDVRRARGAQEPVVAGAEVERLRRDVEEQQRARRELGRASGARCARRARRGRARGRSARRRRTPASGSRARTPRRGGSAPRRRGASRCAGSRSAGRPS